jgi:hypothetical protein
MVILDDKSQRAGNFVDRSQRAVCSHTNVTGHKEQSHYIIWPVTKSSHSNVTSLTERSNWFHCWLSTQLIGRPQRAVARRCDRSLSPEPGSARAVDKVLATTVRHRTRRRVIHHMYMLTCLLSSEKKKQRNFSQHFLEMKYRLEKWLRKGA